MRLVSIAALAFAVAAASCSSGSRKDASAGDSGNAVDSPDAVDSSDAVDRVDSPDAGDAGADSPTGGIPGHCGDGTVFCNSACGICVLVGGACRIDTCGNGDGGEVCGNGPRCGDGTTCVDFTCVPR